MASSSSKVEHSSVSKDLNTFAAIVKSTEHDDCHGHSCTGNGCCVHFCTCLLTLNFSTNKSGKLKSKLLSSKINWSYFNYYLSPVLDPSLKPPLFS
jgi:hypothetical protein